MIRFLCGCTSHLELPIPSVEFDEDFSNTDFMTKKLEQVKYLSTFDGISFDEEGFIVCSEHHQRRYGWRAPNHTARYAGLSDKQYEDLIVWGNYPVEEKLPPLHSSAVDLRPHIYEGMLDEKARVVLARARFVHSMEQHRTEGRTTHFNVGGSRQVVEFFDADQDHGA